MKIVRRLASLAVLCALVIAFAVVWLQRETIADWFQLRNYVAPVAIAQLADQTTMTPKARHLFYVNHPQIESSQEFNKHCTNKTEQTVVLGCYLGNRLGIYLFDVHQSELNGVEQVTAAHEMLHQAYDRLSSAEQQRVNGLLQDYYNHGLTDQTVKDQMASYKKTEPTAVIDEMHSVFGTEVSNLPPALEQYYKQYFTDRSQITQDYTSYQAAFTSRNQKILGYDTQLAGQKKQITDLQMLLETQLQQLDAQKAVMDQKRADGDAATYNTLVANYNQLVNTYNSQLMTLRDLINKYNSLVAERNAIAVQEQELQQDLSSQPLTAAPSQ